MTELITRRILIPDGYEDLSVWPDVNVELLDATDAELFKSKRTAIRSYLIGKKKLTDIAQDHNISMSEIVRLAKRCMETHPDGRIWGFRVLTKYTHTKKYERNANIDQSSNGYAGAFTRLLDVYPSVKTLIDTRILKRIYKGRLKVGKVSIKRLQKDFVDELKRLGVTGYPLDCKEQGLRSLTNYVKKLKQENLVEKAEVFDGEDISMVLENTGKGISPKLIQRPFKRVECDEHKIDLITTICMPLPFGGYKYITLPRFWIIVVEETKSTAVLGYHIALKPHYSKLDIQRAIARCFESKYRRAKVIPEFNKIPGGLPVDLLPDLQWVAWDDFLYDRHLTHKAQAVKHTLIKKVGCIPTMGKARTPIRRPYIERFFEALEEKLHQLPNTTGSHPKDPSRVQPEKSAIKYGITAEEITELLDVIIAEYNVNTDRPTLGYRSPIQIIEQDMISRETDGLPYRKVPPNYQKHIEIVGQTYLVPIKNAGNKRRPHINFLHQRYTNDVLANSPELVGKNIKILVDPDDLRYVTAYLPSGKELGYLQAHGDWGIIPHTMETRKDYYKDENKDLRARVNEEDALSIYLMALAERALSKRRDASRWASAMNIISSKNIEEVGSLLNGQSSRQPSETMSQKKYNIPPRRSIRVIVEE